MPFRLGPEIFKTTTRMHSIKLHFFSTQLTKSHFLCVKTFLLSYFTPKNSPTILENITLRVAAQKVKQKNVPKQWSLIQFCLGPSLVLKTKKCPMLVHFTLQFESMRHLIQEIPYVSELCKFPTKAAYRITFRSSL